MIPALPRINALAKKKREEGLTKAEEREQKKLHQEYLQAIRGQVKGTFSKLKVVDPLGSDVTPETLKEAQKNNTVTDPKESN